MIFDDVLEASCILPHSFVYKDTRVYMAQTGCLCSSLVCEIPSVINGTFVTEPLKSHESVKVSVH